MNQTATFHIIGTAAIGAGVVLSGTALTVGLLLVGALLIVTGIILARRGDESQPAGREN